MNTTVKIESRNHKYATTYGGRIYVGDFEFMTMGDVTARLVNNYAFDRQCIQNAKIREKTIRYRESHVYKEN